MLNATFFQKIKHYERFEVGKGKFSQIGNFPLDFKENVNRSTLLLANWFFKRAHSLQKSPKKSHCELVYILSGQKFIKNAKNGQFGPILENLKQAVKQCYQTCHY